MKRDTRTLDLLSWAPPEPAPAFDEAAVRAANLRDRISRAIAETLRELGAERDAVAGQMGAFLGEEVPKASLDQYASQGAADRSIPLLRAIALLVATDDARVIQAALDPTDYVVVQRRWLPAIREAQLREKQEQIEAEIQRARREWKGQR